MKVTQKLKKELAQWLDTYWTTYLKGDIETWSTFIRDDYRNIGGTKEEIWNSKQEIIDYTHSILDQMVGTAEIRNREIEVIPYGEFMMVNEFTDLYVKIDNEWELYGPFRMSSLLEKTDTGWIALHQHGSYPDMKAMEGEAFSVDALKAENTKLQKAVKNRTIELEEKNRELEIETALERVRARTMAMQHSDELSETSFVLFQEFQKLGETSDQISIGIFKEDENVMELYSTLHGSQWKEAAKVDLSEPVVMKKIHAGWKKKKHSLVIDLEGDQLKKYNTYRKKLSNLTYKEKRWVIQVAFFSKGVLTFSSIEPHPKETIQLLERFAIVFDGTYTRFLDLQKAEAQARESQIELGLERVRARAMAMQTSNELSELVDTVFKELTKLDFEISMCIINIIDESTLSNMVWGANPETGKPPESYYMKFEDYPFHHAMMKGYKERAQKYIYVIEGEEKKNYDEYLFNETEFRKMPAEAQAASRAMKRYVASFSFSNFGGLQTVGSEPLSEANLDIFARFGKVFDLTYTRFNDLLKAEAQARESQIELGLERVRARAMAMQKSDELKELISTVFTELTKLDLVLTRCRIMIYDPISNGSTWWMANSEAPKDPIGLYVKNHQLPPYAAYIKAWKERKNKWQYVLEEKDKKDWDEFLFTQTELLHLPDFVIAGMKAPDRVYLSASFNNFGCLNLASLEPLSAEHFDILLRFAKVFDLTYTRFNDLQKSEAQAKESRIELALERVRARTMAMQKSEELKEVIQVVYDQFVHLNINVEHTGFILDYKERDDMYIWLADKHEVPSQVTIPYFDSSHWNSFIDAKAKGKNFFPTLLSFEEKNKFYQDLFKLFPVPDEAKEYYFSCTGLAGSTVLLDNVSLYIENFQGIPFTDEENNTLMRLGKVFQQTYTRFLDLQKAEAQARESQIQLALERVRARTMAMQKSDELQDAAILLFQQMKALGVQTGSCGFNIWNKHEKAATVWMSSAEGGLQAPFKMPHTESAIYKNVYAAMKNGEDLLMKEVGGKALKKHFDYLSTLPGIGDVIKHLRETGYSFPETMVYHFAFFNNGYLSFHLHEHSTEAPDIFKRFAKVFNQTYTRFLDLQKAEAQAREAEIQLALERVRARTMAMQHSDELAETSELLFQQINELGIHPWSCGFNLWYEDDTYFKGYNPGPDGKIGTPLRIPLTEDVFFKTIWEAKHQGEEFFVFESEGESLAATYHYMDTLPVVGDFMRAIVNSGYELPKYQVTHCGFFPQGHLMFITLEPHPEDWDIFKRFTKEFEQTYTRFLDLQKAEAQAKESQIQLALERVRARTMAMQNSDELRETVLVINEQLQQLNFESNAFNIIILDKDSGDAQYWVSGFTKDIFPVSYQVPWFDHPYYEALLQPWKRGDQYAVNKYEGNGKKSFDKIWFTKTDFKNVPGEAKQAMMSLPAVTLSTAFFSNGALQLIGHEALSEEKAIILQRFAKVFNQTYTRFLDLQKAEAQVREAKIEAALEKVRSRSLAMHKSDELQVVVNEVFERLRSLDIDMNVASIFIFKEGAKDWEQWVASSDTDYSTHFHLPYTDNEIFRDLEDAKKSGKDFYAAQYSFAQKNEWFNYAFGNTEYSRIPDERKKFLLESEFFKISFALAKNTGLQIAKYSGENFSEKDNDVLRRFSKVFEQAYIRFLDLQKAEAQAREAQIEAALERVRSRTMAMQNSDELADLVATVFKELNRLEFALTSCIIWINNPELLTAEMWVASTEMNKPPEPYYIKPFRHPYFESVINAWKKKNKKWVYKMAHEEKMVFEKQFFNEVGSFPTLIKKALEAPESVVYSASFYHFGALEIIGTEPVTDEKFEILHRLGKVFDMSYTRFNDLKQAEAQAREAKIEVALERVRSKAMSMHNSEDLADTIAVFYYEVGLLSVTPRRCGVGLIDKETHIVELSAMSTTEQGVSAETIGKLKLVNHPVLEGIYDNWILQKEYHPVLRGNKIKEYYQLIRPQIAYPDYPTDSTQYGYFFFFNEGGVYAWTVEQLSDDELKIYRRFTSVLSLTYKRYKDLKDAEANGREAIKRASLDRVRAETAYMRTPEDLQRIIPLLWNELTILSIPFIRCGVFIMDEQNRQIQSFLSTPDGKAIAAFQLPYASAGELSKVLLHWQKKEMYKDHWNETAFMDWTKSLLEQGAITSKEQYSTAHRPVSLDLHFLPFLQGMLYVGSEAPLSNEEIQVVQSLADAFSTAYARYEDFNKLELAKVQIEKTLVDLKAAQAQLIQSEKMASLGELTAGIAHEIQNPLNFVNNFSEVSNELIDEMKQELLKTNYEDANAIADDLKQNLEKINHHGKRAGDIVKGMLQHSRTSTGVKEPTNINALADEYLRLSYHGLRAKDKSFNAEMITDLDNSIGKINIIPQDIGRVLLNLFNNAFYACAERSRNTVNEEKTKNLISYEPTVTVRTSLNPPLEGREASVLITVSDNGNGIPKSIVDKIFQPFFTTKPTGSGTGLGLSLSYDIVKAHGGEIRVESKEGKGTTFTILIPTIH